MSDADDYFVAGPVSTGGLYADRRSNFDGFLGTVDGIASGVNSVGNVVGEVVDIREDWLRGQAVADEVRLDREERELGLVLDQLKVERGDNKVLYFALAAGAVAVVFLMR